MLTNLTKSISTIKAITASTLLLLSGCAATDGSSQGHGTVADGNADAPIQDSGTFTNPLFPNGADPWLEYWDGNYYLTTTTWTSELVMRKSPTLAGLAEATPVNVWSSADVKRNANFWAFEFHRLKGPNGYRWYMMYTAGEDGTLDKQHLNVLESAGDDPMGPYEYKGALIPNVWNIDGNYLEFDDRLFVIYSQWQGDQQLNIIAEMDTPWSLKEGVAHTILTRPELDWEISGRKVTEGAEILQRNGRTFMTYSASFCNTPDYKLGLLELVGNDPMNFDHWKKYDKPVFERTESVFGPGHNGFFQSPDGKEDWLVYHGNDSVEHGCSSTRSLRAQKFTWHEDGTPNFGKPLTPGVEVAPPSGEYGPIVTRVQGQQYQIVNATTGFCLDTGTDPQEAKAVQKACSGTNGKWVLDAMSDGYVRLANQEDSRFLEVADCKTTDNAKLRSAAWRNTYCQQWQVNNSSDGNVTFTNRYSGKSLVVAGCLASANQSVLQSSDSACAEWQLRPIGEVVLLSQQSGKTLSYDGQATIGNNVQQSAWNKRSQQRWLIEPTESGYVALKPKDGKVCLGVAGGDIVPGANATLEQCSDATSQWQMVPVKGGGMVFVNRYNKQALGLENCGLAEQTNFALQPVMKNNCQVFQLRQSL